MRIKRFNTAPSLVLGRVEANPVGYSDEDARKNGVCYIRVAEQVLAIRQGSRSLRYLSEGQRYAIA